MKCNDIISNGLEPDPNIDAAEWANTYFYLPRTTAKEFGKYRLSRMPFMKEILQELSPQSKTQTVVMLKPVQLGGTTLSNILMCYYADLFPCPMMHVSPTTSLAIRHSKKRVQPTIEQIPRLKGKIRDARSRDSGNTILLKEFDGGSWTFTGANSPTQARSDSIRVLVLDDYDGFPIANDEGDPGDLFKKRTDSYGSSRKIFINSTPTTKNVSPIEREYLKSSQGLYNVPCPECGAMFEFLWGYLKFNKVKVEEKTIYMECPGCHAQIKEYQKTKMMASGKWIHTYPDNSIKGYKFNSFYSPMGMVPWIQVIEEFMAAQGSIEKLKVWTNTRISETWEESGEQPPWLNLKTRCEPYEPMTIPKGVKILTAGIDTHDNRLDIVIRGWGDEEENYLIYWGQLWGDPGLPECWNQLNLLLNYDYKDVDGKIYKLRWCSIDAMGHRTMDVYNYCMTKYPIVIPIHGSKSKTSQILNGAKKKDVNYKGRMIKNGVELWSVGTELAKATIYQRLNLIQPGRGYYHFYQGLPDEYFLQLTSEKLITHYVDGFPRQKWVVTRPGGENHGLDCEVYAYHAALRAGVDRFSSNQLPRGIVKPKRRIISKGVQL